MMHNCYICAILSRFCASEASRASNPKLASESWTGVVDFVGYVIFFLKELSAMEQDALSKCWFYFKYLPFSACRSRVEFKIIYALFRDT
jgi:hypothetical protein